MALRPDPSAALPASVPALVRARAAAWPDAVALVDARERLTFAALLERAGDVARRLRAAEVAPGAAVGVSARRSAAAVVAMLGVQEAGAVCVPLDPTYPRERLQVMLEDSGVAVVLSDEPARERSDLATVLALDASGAPPGGLHGRALGEGIGWLFYTSGSTGRPKGVLLRQATIVARLADEPLVWADGDRGVLKSSLSYGDSLWEMLAPLVHGRPCVVADDDTARDPRLLSRLIEREGVTRLLLVPALLSAMLSLPPADRARLGGIRSCIATGERLTGALAERFYAVLPDATLLDVYGTTECWEACWHAVPRDVRAGDVVPIGSRLFAGVRAWVVDEALAPLPPGEPGELLVAGPGVSAGYHARPELTAERFVAPPAGEEDAGTAYRTGDLVVRHADGTLELVGRRDLQINLRGFRVELLEVERWLRDCPGVLQAAVVAMRDDDDTVTGLTALVVPAAGEQPAVAGLRRALAEHVPDHCLPSRWIRLERLPLLSNGKLDRGALTTLAAYQPASLDVGEDTAAPQQPHGEVERTLVQIWRELLGVERVGVSDNFFDLGGSSLLAVQVVIRVERELGVEVPLRDFYARPTIATLGEALRA
jgi:amino acid adenylation domain-containing protein